MPSRVVPEFHGISGFPIMGFNAEDLGEVFKSEDGKWMVIGSYYQPLYENSTQYYTILITDPDLYSKTYGIEINIPTSDKKRSFRLSGAIGNTYKGWKYLRLKVDVPDCEELCIECVLVTDDCKEYVINIIQKVAKRLISLNDIKKECKNLSTVLPSIGTAALSTLSALHSIVPPISTPMSVPFVLGAELSAAWTANGIFNTRKMQSNLIGNERVTEELSFENYRYLIESNVQLGTLAKVPTKVLAALVYDIRDSVTNEYDTYFARLGLCRIRPGAIAMAIGENGLDGEAIIALGLPSEAARDVEKQIFGNPYENELIQSYNGEGISECFRVKQHSSTGTHLAFISRFPKANLAILNKLLSRLAKNRQINFTRVETFNQIEIELRELFGDFYCIQDRLRGIYDEANTAVGFAELSLYSAEYSERIYNKCKNVIKILNSPYIGIIASNGAYARTVTANIDIANKEVTSVDDPCFWGYGLSPEAHSKTDIWNISSFGWNIGNDLKMNKENICLDSIIDSEYVLMDVGFWGHYDRGNPRRDFGVIENNHVWLCRLLGANEEKELAVTNTVDFDDATLRKHKKMIKHATVNTIEIQEKASGREFKILRLIVDRLFEQYELNCIVTCHTAVPCTNNEVGIPCDHLFLFLPDMHLPSKWPDFPDKEKLYQHGDYEEVRAELREHLLKFQIKNEYKSKELMQQILSNPSSILLDDHSGIQIVNEDEISISSSTECITAENLCAEFKVVQRKTRLDNSWFYPPAEDNNPILPPFLLDRYKTPLKKSDLDADPLPAVDLAALLLTIRELQELGSTISVVQVGDLLEMWMGEEYLYKDFFALKEVEAGSNRKIIHGPCIPSIDMEDTLFKQKLVISIFEASDKTFKLCIKPQMRFGKKWHTYSGWKDYRSLIDLDRLFVDERNQLLVSIRDIDIPMGWGSFQRKVNYSSENTYDHMPYLFNLNKMLCKTEVLQDDTIPLYGYHAWPFLLMLFRYPTGYYMDDIVQYKLKSMMSSDKINTMTRINDECVSRIRNIQEYKSVWPGNKWIHNNVRMKALHEVNMIVNNSSQDVLRKYKLKDSYWCDQEHRYEGSEYFWNALVLDLLNSTGCTMICGNHDGYRGDPAIKDCIMDNTQINENTKCILRNVYPWHSSMGIWAEHGHRWDDFNIDGMAFGPAITNIAHYLMRPYIQVIDKQLDKYLPELQSTIIPGCTQWYVLVNGRKYKDKSTQKYTTPYYHTTNNAACFRNPKLGKDESKRVLPFNVYVKGHSHTADLIRVKLKRKE